MAPRMQEGLFLGAVGATATFGFLGGSAFVAAPGAGNLRAPASQALAGSSPAGTSAPNAGLGATACVGGFLLAVAGTALARRSGPTCRAASKEITTETIPRPEDLLESPKFPMYIGSTGGYMSRSTRERHAITWTAKAETMFEMPTSGMAIMNKGENLCYFRKKEQCIALGKQLRKMKIDNYKIYRLKKDGTVIFLHPADGVFPEKVNKGRVQVNGRPFSAGSNPQPGLLKWTKYQNKPYEADALTTMFVKARLQAWDDQENLFPLPQPTPEDWLAFEDVEEYRKKQYEAATSSL